MNCLLKGVVGGMMSCWWMVVSRRKKKDRGRSEGKRVSTYREMFHGFDVFFGGF